jgi:phospho-N-acetylmuramoyl-pentapeptide-transferase
MLYHLLYPLNETYAVFNVFRYITFRTTYAVLTALIISFIVGPWLIGQLKMYNIGESIREDGPKTHFSKEGTPTMGGIQLLIALIVPTLLWADLTNKYIWLVLFSTVGFGAVGFADDYLKIIKKNGCGLKARYKLLIQTGVGVALALLFYHQFSDMPGLTRLSFPFFKNYLPDLSWAYFPLLVLVVVGTTNAVNLTDGLDGLAIGPMIIATMTYAVIAYVVGHSGFARYLNIVYVQGVGELAILSGSMVGAGLGFLWFNSYPAQLFMGNVGSMALGGALGAIAVATRHELVLILVGGLFFIETVSVILQVASYRLTGKRIFRMAPLHHHFEEKGWSEPKVIVRFWILAIILALIGLSTLKLR